MANNKSAEKRNRQAERRNLNNRMMRTRLRGAVKKLREAVAEGNKELAQELLPKTCSIVDSTAQKGVVHRNAAARTKSRLAHAVATLG
jgi:small subunit ribosomal protein S20